MSELDAQISALLERLGAPQEYGDGKVEDALKPTEIVAPEDNDDILPGGP